MKFSVPKGKDDGYFKTWISLTSQNGKVVVFEKESADSETPTKTKFLRGIASNTGIDKENDMMDSGFIRKMRATAVGLNVFVEHEHTIAKTVGVISDAGGDDNNFEATTALEPEEDNPLVKTILQKITNGIKIGYSVAGRITKVAKVEIAGKIVTKILDGDLYEISLTAMPAANGTWVAPLAKSAAYLLEKGLELSDDPKEEPAAIEKTTAEIPSWFGITKELPVMAYAKVGELTDEKTWAFPHHYWKEKELPVHLTGVIVSWACVKKNETEARKHLLEHARKDFNLNALQLNEAARFFVTKHCTDDLLAKEVERIKATKRVFNDENDVVKALDEMLEADDLRQKLSDLFWAFRDAISQITFSELEADDKKAKIMSLADEYASKVSEIATALTTVMNTIVEEIGVAI